METSLIILHHHIENESIDAMKQVFIVQKQFGEQTEALTIQSGLMTRDFKGREFIIATNLWPGWIIDMWRSVLLEVLNITRVSCIILETALAERQDST
jgi:hypothetical protein